MVTSYGKSHFWDRDLTHAHPSTWYDLRQLYGNTVPKPGNGTFMGKSSEHGMELGHRLIWLMKLQAAIFCQSERHLAICYVSSSNRQKLFPFLLVTLPIFVGDIYIYIYIYMYIYSNPWSARIRMSMMPMLMMLLLLLPQDGLSCWAG